MFKKLIHKYYINRYCSLGIVLGDLLSYAYMEALGYQSPEKQSLILKFIKAEKQIYNLGYQPYHLNLFIEAGGYGVLLPALAERSLNLKYEIDPYLLFELTHQLSPEDKKQWYKDHGVSIEIVNS